MLAQKMEDKINSVLSSDEVPMGREILTREDVIRRLLSGQGASLAQVSDFPDLVQISDLHLLETSLKSLLRKPKTPAGARYVYAETEAAGGHVYHVVPVPGRGDTLVSKIVPWKIVGASGLHHDPYNILDEEIIAAKQVYVRVEKFLADPMGNVSLICLAKPAKSISMKKGLP